MGSKNFAIQLREIKEREYNIGLRQGIEFGKLIGGIALNNLHHFGVKRIDEFEAEVDRIIMEEINGKEPELIRAQLERRLNQIGGKR